MKSESEVDEYKRKGQIGLREIKVGEERSISFSLLKIA